MRSPLVSTAAAWRLLFLFGGAVVAVDPAVAQSPPSLSDTIALASGDVWSENTPGTVMGTPAGDPVLSEGYLAPISADDAAAMAAGGEIGCNSCNGGGGGGAFYNRCGCDTPMFPYLTGPGNCDNWCVGPHWNVEVEGMALRRTGVDWSGVEALATATPGFATELLDNFGYGPGGRIFVTGYNDSDYGIQIGYEGINDYNATALFVDPNIDPDDPSDDNVRSFNYETTFNSIEMNFMRRTTAPTKIFAGFRYVQVDEDFADSLTQAKTVPAANDPALTDAYVDTRDLIKLENRMIGFQVGALRDAWALNKWLTIEPFGNGGVYYNNFKREDLQDTVDTLVTGPDTGTLAPAFTSSSFTQFGTSNNFSEISFLGEVGVTAVFRLNQCVAIRGGYQALVMDGVGTGLDAYFEPGLNGTTVLYHGARFGLEYQR